MIGDLLDALESMPEKRLHANLFDDGKDCVCALGAVARLRGVDTTHIDPEDYCSGEIAPLLDIAGPLAAEVMFINDEGWATTPEQRWGEVYGWARRHFKGSRLPFAPPSPASFVGTTGEEPAARYPFRLRRPLWRDECIASAGEYDSRGDISECRDRCVAPGEDRD